MATLDNKTIFIGVGAQKAGTTWLNEALLQYEEVAVPHIKELHYFDIKWLPPAINPISIRVRWTKELKNISTNIADTLHSAMKDTLNNVDDSCEESGIFSDDFLVQYGLENRSKRIIDLANVLSIKNDTDYMEYFKMISKYKSVVGEITPAYSMLPINGLINIKTLFPDVKIIFLMRDPIDRFISQMKFKNKMNKQQARDTLDLEKEYHVLLDDENFLFRSDYMDILTRLNSVFATKNILIIFYEDLLGNSCVSEMRKIESFLSLAPKTDDEILSWKNVVYNATEKESFSDDLKKDAGQKFKYIYEYIFNNFENIPKKWKSNYQLYSL